MKIVYAIWMALFFCSAAVASTEIPESGPIADLYVKAKSGEADAQYNLAEAFKDGNGVTKDMRTALKWYKRAAAQGNVDAQFALGFVYRGGDGIPEDKILSYMWFDIASRNGDPRAFDLRNDVAWSMNRFEIDAAREKSRLWKPQKETGAIDDEDDDDEQE